MKTTTIATINSVAIVMNDDSQKLVPIKPICDALGIAYQSQISKLKEDDFLNSVITLSVTTGADGKSYEMVCLPFEYIFGWLFTINPKNVKEESREIVARYRIECYKALYNYFTEPNTFLAQKQQLIEAKLREYDLAKDGFKFAKNIMDEKRKEFDAVRKFTIEEWRANKGQFLLPFAPEAEEGASV